MPFKYSVEIVGNNSALYHRTNDHDDAVKVAKAWNADGYEVRMIEDRKTVLTHMPARSTDAQAARFDLDVEVIQAMRKIARLTLELDDYETADRIRLIADKVRIKVDRSPV
jgi:hypothetical protein